MMQKSSLFGVLAAVLLLAVYLPTLQTIPNGSEHYFMIDVGETQIVLNRWGTLHATGYPHYVITGNVLVAILRTLGVAPATAPALVSLLWGGLALAILYALARKLTGNALLAAGMVILYSLTRTIWIHHVIAEIYTFGLLILVALLAMALWTPPIRHRLYWLALLGGVGVAHHRAIGIAAPALLYAVLPDLTHAPRKLPRKLVVCLLHGLIGFIPYAYLMLRAWAGADWVYGEPGTLAGLWDQFTGREAARFIGAPATWDGLLANINLINSTLLTDVTLPGLIAGMVGLLLGLKTHRPAALTFLISGVAAYGFHILLYTDILSALILPITLSLAFGWLFLAEWIVINAKAQRREGAKPVLYGIAIAGFSVFGWSLFSLNQPFIYSLTHDPLGLETIDIAKGAPPNSTLMLAWGSRYFAIGFTKDVLNELPSIRLVDHKADYRALLNDGALVTPEYTFYNQPLSWWEDQLGGRVYLDAVAPYLVQISTASERRKDDATPIDSAENGVALLSESVECGARWLGLHAVWTAAETPSSDLSIFVHLLDASGEVIAQADQAAPVYGWRPMTTWAAGDVVRDVYALPRLESADAIRYGLYEQSPTGEFNNLIERTVTIVCEP